MYFESRNKKDSEEICKSIMEVKPPFKIQLERMGKRSMEYIQANRYFHGVIVRSYMKHTGYTFSKSKMNLLIKNACVAEVGVEHEEKINEFRNIFHLFKIRNVIYVCERVSGMKILRFLEFIDQTLIDLDDEGIELMKNNDYKHEQEMNLTL